MDEGESSNQKKKRPNILIREMEIGEKNVHLTMILTTPFCPYGPQLMEQTRATVEHALETPTTIEMGMEMWDPSMMEEGAGSWRDLRVAPLRSAQVIHRLRTAATLNSP